jgi:hypothetical protein
LRLSEEAPGSILCFGSNAGRFVVRRTQNSGALLTQTGDQGGFVENGVGGPALSLGQLALHFRQAILEGLHLAAQAVEVLAYFTGVETLANGAKISPVDIGRGVSGRRVNASVVHCL